MSLSILSSKCTLPHTGPEQYNQVQPFCTCVKLPSLNYLATSGCLSGSSAMSFKWNSIFLTVWRLKNPFCTSVAAIREKREAKGKDKKRYKELKAEVQRQLRVDQQQQLEDTCMELEAANSKGNSRQLFQIVKSMTRKFQPRLQGIQSVTGENLTKAAQIADGWKGYCEDLYCDEKGKGIEQEYWEQEPFRRCSCHPSSVRQQVAKPQVLMRPQQNDPEWKLKNTVSLNTFLRFMIVAWIVLELSLGTLWH